MPQLAFPCKVQNGAKWAFMSIYPWSSQRKNELPLRYRCAPRWKIDTRPLNWPLVEVARLHFLPWVAIIRIIYLVTARIVAKEEFINAAPQEKASHPRRTV